MHPQETQYLQEADLISEFMGEVIFQPDITKTKIYSGKNMRDAVEFLPFEGYNTLMDCIERIETLGYEVVISTDKCGVFTVGASKAYINVIQNKNKHEAVKQTVLKFIAWYNKNIK